MENLKGQSSGKNWQTFLKLSSQQETPWLFLAVALSLHHLTAPDKSKKQCKHIQTISNNQITRPDADSFTRHHQTMFFRLWCLTSYSQPSQGPTADMGSKSESGAHLVWQRLFPHCSDLLEFQRWLPKFSWECLFTPATSGGCVRVMHISVVPSYPGGGISSQFCQSCCVISAFSGHEIPSAY